LGFKRKLRWWLAFIAGTLTLTFTGDLEAAKHVLEKLFEKGRDYTSE
jgi:hypothetical protein